MATKKKKTSTTKAPAKKAPAKKAAKKAAPAKKASKKSAAAKPAAKKSPAKKAAKKAPAAKKTAKKTTKKAPAKKTATKKAASKKTATKKTASKKTAAKPAATKKTAAKPAASKKTAAKPAASKKTAAKKTAAKKTATKKTAVKKTATTKKTATKKTTAATKKTASKKTAAAKPAATASKKTATMLHAPPTGHGNVYLGARTIGVPASYEAAATLIPDADDALDEAMGDAFDTLFSTPPKPAKAQKPTEPFVPGDPSLDLAQICAALALEKKAEDVVILQVAELTSYADYFVIAAATSDRQAQGVARTISDELRKNGRQPLSTDGMDQGNWVVLDYGSVVVHVFMNSARAYYDLDGFWSDAPKVAVDEGRGQGALAHLAAQQALLGDEAS